MHWRGMLGLVCVMAATSLGCAASSSAVASSKSKPSTAQSGRRGSNERAQRSRPCCGAAREGPFGEGQSGEPAGCDELERLEAQFAGAKPIRVLVGKATYYSDSLSGNLMASGERYRPDCAQAAHRTLPFGSIARVRMVKTGATVVVRIADRGPFAGKNRIIDLSHAAARRIGLLRPGVADVRVEVLQVP